MEIELRYIDLDADVYDVRKAVAAVLHGPDLYDPNDRENKGRVPNFEIVMDTDPAGHIHDGKAILRVGSKLGHQLIKWNRESEENNIVVNGIPLEVFDLLKTVPRDVKLYLERALYIDPDQDRLRAHIEEQARQVRLRIAKVQFGVWYNPSNTRGQRRAFSVEYERNFISNSAAYIYLVYEHKLIIINVSATLLPRKQVYLTSLLTQIWQRKTELIYTICVKFSTVRKLGISYDKFGQACEYPWHIPSVPRS